MAVKVEELVNDYKDIDDKIATLRKRLSGDRVKILDCMDDLGLICASEV